MRHVKVRAIDLCWAYLLNRRFHCKHNLIHSYIQSLNPVLKILKFKYLQIRHKACLSPFLVTNQSFPRKSSNTASATIVRHMQSAQRFHMKSRPQFSPPPHTHGNKIHHRLELSDNQIPSSPGRQRFQMPGVCPGGMLKARFDRYITVFWMIYGGDIVERRSWILAV